jgi:acetyl esterase/lipase
VRFVHDLRYGSDARHGLDLYLPSRADFPVVLFVHGGQWTYGDKALYAHLGCFLARHGIGAVVANYRLSPGAQHPAHVQDVAAALAWTRKHLPAHGGDTDRHFLMGHSAGGHLVSLLATDESHLGPWGLSPDHIAGVVAISGVYHVHINVSLYGLGHVFRGADRWAASPLCHVKPGCPPFLILYAQREAWTLAGQARKFHARLQACRGRSRILPVPDEDHVSIVHSIAAPGAAHGRHIVRFLRGE